ncbi:inositol-3-phosphate synthase [Halovivax limisalsi]|uniref:inositol-3-phosphate synthase n=1 Tax=Halovivax limisalsi TaxID=1453760 RepID=UPI001FFD27C5|nr:inositol-3-phosphate synthase [Halovivax limisalsi]
MTDVGVWFVGARGNIATTAIVGALAIARGETATTGMVTERPPCETLDLPDVGDLTFAGHDIRNRSLRDAAERLEAGGGVPSNDTIEAVADELETIDERVCRGTALNCGPRVRELADGPPLEADRSVAEIVERLRDDYAAFRDRHDLDRVIVVNVASTEPELSNPKRYADRAAIERAIEADDRELPASSLYAYAALADGHPYANFTPSPGSSLGGLRELAVDEDVPHTGADGKTGESLVKAALAPMFAGRNLRVMSWEAHNVLGNTDGHVLEDDRNKAGKLASKGGILDGILPEIDHDRVRIDYTPSLGDWKTAWDYVHFEGFLETEMKMQFTWEGSDSALAAPLTLDLARLLSHADERGESGLQRHLASFFKAPVDVDEHDLSRQLDMLSEYVEERTGERPGEPLPSPEARTD